MLLIHPLEEGELTRIKIGLCSDLAASEMQEQKYKRNRMAPSKRGSSHTKVPLLKRKNFTKNGENHWDISINGHN